jgi:hypothetical protein
MELIPKNSLVCDGGACSNRCYANDVVDLLRHHAMQLYVELPSESVGHTLDSDMVYWQLTL